jgi:transketolase C-terminal domain/subunit
VFLTGDLGFEAFEPLRDALKCFINAEVAEENMVVVAAAPAHAGLGPWVYSIAPLKIPHVRRRALSNRPLEWCSITTAK